MATSDVVSQRRKTPNARPRTALRRASLDSTREPHARNRSGWGGELLTGAPSINILEPDDIVLTEIGTGLDLDEKSRDLSRVGEAMLLPDGDVGRLVLAQQFCFLPFGDLECPSDHHPVL